MYSEYGSRRRGGCLAGALTGIGILVVLVILGWIFLPKIAVQALFSDEAVSPVPRETRQELRSGIDQAVDELGRYGISREGALELVDELSVEDARNIIDELLASDELSGRNIVAVVAEHVDLSSVDRDLLAQDLEANLNREEFRRAIEDLNRNRIALPVLLPAAKEAIRETLLQGIAD